MDDLVVELLMAVENLDELYFEMPHLFQKQSLSGEFDETWEVIPIDEPESGEADRFESAAAEWSEEGDNATKKKEPLGGSTVVPAWPVAGGYSPEWMPNGYPGAWVPWDLSPVTPYPPPDALAFYLPFHYFFVPDRWGVYIVLEGAQHLARMLAALGAGSIGPRERLVAARTFLYRHEHFHHQVECFATRVELITNQATIYLTI